MYTRFYHLDKRPFELTPDHHFFFVGGTQKKAIAYLTYGLSKGEGFVVITGEVGAGKTTLINHLLSHLEGKHVVSAKLVTTDLEGDNLLRMVAATFGLRQEGVDKATLLRDLEAFFVDCCNRHKHPLLIVDECQKLPLGSLDELRMLSNFQLGEKPLLQTFLIGQPEFRKTIAGEGLEQLRQRVIGTYHLQPLDAEETRRYIQHRLRQAGWRDDPEFTEAAFRAIYEQSGGVPRKTNLLCDRLLLFGYLEETHRIDRSDVDAVITDMHDETTSAAIQPAALPAAAALPTADVAGVSGQATPAAQDAALPPEAPAVPAATAPDPSPAAAPAHTHREEDPELRRLLKRLNLLENRLDDVETHLVECERRLWRTRPAGVEIESSEPNQAGKAAGDSGPFRRRTERGA